MGWETPGYEDVVRSAIAEMKALGIKGSRETLEDFIVQRDAENALQLYWGHYCGVIGNFLEYQRGMSF